jgi:hypothetical protein
LNKMDKKNEEYEKHEKPNSAIWVPNQTRYGHNEGT